MAISQPCLIVILKIQKHQRNHRKVQESKALSPKPRDEVGSLDVPWTTNITTHILSNSYSNPQNYRNITYIYMYQTFSSGHLLFYLCWGCYMCQYFLLLISINIVLISPIPSSILYHNQVLAVLLILFAISIILAD